MRIFIIAAVAAVLGAEIIDKDRIALRTAESRAWQAQAEYWQAQIAVSAAARKAEVAVAELRKLTDEMNKKCGEGKEISMTDLACAPKKTMGTQ